MMDSTRNWVLFSMALGFVPACSAGTTDRAELAGTGSSSTLTAAGDVSGFESLSAWSITPSSVTRALTTDRVEGESALAVGNLNGYASLVSDVTSAPTSIGTSITLRIKPPAGHAQAAWKGHVQLWIDSPSRGLHAAYLGQATLDGLTSDTFGSVSFSVPAEVRTALAAGSASDVSYTLSLSVPLDGPYLLDALEFGGGDVTVSDPTATPTPVAYTGGGDVALLWEPIVWSKTTVRYDLYRDGQLIGAAPPKLYKDRDSSASYIDASVVANQTYSYEVQAVAEDGTRAARSAAVSITHSTAGVPVPTITIDEGAYPHTRPFLELGKAFLKTWYPKIANLLAYPEYLPPGNITLRAVGESQCFGSGWVDVNHPDVVHICAYASVENSDDVGLFVHEATHLIQKYSGPQLASAGEGIASWAGNLATGLDHKRPGMLDSHFDDYEYGAYFFDWIAETYEKPNFVHDLNLVCHYETYTPAWLKQYTGYTLGEMFSQMMGATYTSPGALRNAAGFYAFPSDSALTPGSRIILLEDPPTNEERFFQGPLAEESGLDQGSGPLRWEKEVCLGEDAQGFVVVQKCKSSTPTPWLYMSNSGAFLNVETLRCLQPQDGVSANAVPLVTAPCTGSTLQRWDPLPP